MKVNEYLDAHHMEMVSALRSLVRIPSVRSAPAPDMPFGEPVAGALSHALNIAQSLGMRVRNVDNYMGVVEIGGGEESLGILTHLDVVPEGRGWNHEPFGGEISDGVMYGRGTVDNKGPTVAALFALAAVKNSGLPLKRRAQVLLGCDQEGRMECAEYYKRRAKMPDLAFAPGARYPVANVEKTLLRLDVKKNLRVKSGDIVSIRAEGHDGMVPSYAEAVVRLSLEELMEAAERTIEHAKVQVSLHRAKQGTGIEVEGTCADASMPEEGNSALTALLYMLSLLPLRGEVAEALRLFARAFRHNDHYGVESFVDCSDETSGRLTQTPVGIELGTRQITLRTDMRVPLTISTDEVLVRLSATFPTCVVGKCYERPGHHMDSEHPLVQTLMDVYTGQTGKEASCITTGASTLARAMPGRAVSFGCALPNARAKEHAAEEHFHLDELLLNAKMMASAIEKLCV